LSLEAVSELGCSPSVFLDALAKRLIDASAGRGGIEVLLQFLEALDFIPELAPIRGSIKRHSIFFETALGKCDKERLKLPLQKRHNEISELLGFKCQKCGYESSGSWMTALSRCPKCKGQLTPYYVSIEMDMLKRGLEMTPEAVLMHVAYDRVAEAYVEGYEGVRLVMSKTAEVLGWAKYRIDQPEIRSYMDRYRLGQLSGETHIPREEKQLLQFLVRGNMAGIPKEDAEKLVRLNTEVLKWGYIFQVLGVSGAGSLYDEAVANYGFLHDEINVRIRKTLTELYAEQRERKIQITKSLGGYYAPCLLMQKHCWETGQLSSDVTFEPYYKLPIFPEADYGPVEIAYAPRGKGKTLLLSAVASYVIQFKREIVFSPMNDKSNSFSLAGLPLFPYDKRTKDLTQTLQNQLDVEPQGVPTLTLTVLRKGEKPPSPEKDPPTVFDRTIEVKDPSGFDVDFDQVMNELKGISERYGFSQPVGLVNVRNLQRFDPATNVYVDAQIASNMLTQFDKWRKSHLSRPARVIIDEVHDIASAQVVLYARDALRTSATISDFIKESRRNRLGLCLATQRPLEIQPDIRDAATNVFFRGLASSKDKMRSEIDFLLDSLQLEDPSERSVVREINNRGIFRNVPLWFWYNQPSYSIEVIQPCPPTFCLQDPKKTPREIFKLYEKQSGKKVLLRNWSQVPVLQSTEKETATAGELLRRRKR